eukprot:6205934-Pleurochrysis_carterae.AAC.3
MQSHHATVMSSSTRLDAKGRTQRLCFTCACNRLKADTMRRRCFRRCLALQNVKCHHERKERLNTKEGMPRSNNVH